jgi:hypothetical protein
MALVLSGCGLPSPSSPLANIDALRSADLLDPEKKNAILKDMAELAKDQQKRAAEVAALTRDSETESP